MAGAIGLNGASQRRRDQRSSSPTHQCHVVEEPDAFHAMLVVLIHVAVLLLVFDTQVASAAACTTERAVAEGEAPEEVVGEVAAAAVDWARARHLPAKGG